MSELEYEEIYDAYSNIEDPLKRVQEFFEDSQHWKHHGGKLIDAKMLTVDLLAVSSQHRMCGHMMVMLMAIFHGELVFTSPNMDCLILRLGDDF